MENNNKLSLRINSSPVVLAYFVMITELLVLDI